MTNKQDRQIIESSGNVFTDLGFERTKADKLLVYSKLIATLKHRLKNTNKAK